MAISLDPATKVFSIPQADLTFVSGTLYTLDSDQYRKDCFDLLASENYIWMDDAFIHNTEVTVAGVTYARTLEYINSYSHTFENTGSAYTVRIEGSNNNIFDIENGILNPTPLVTVISTNSAGLIVTGTSGLSAAQGTQLQELWQLQGLEVGNPVTNTTTSRQTDDATIDIDITGDGVTTSTVSRN
jgi:hypothetical protein